MYKYNNERKYSAEISFNFLDRLLRDIPWIIVIWL